MQPEPAAPTVAIHGLRVRSVFALHGRPAAGPPDLVVDLNNAPPSWERRENEVEVGRMTAQGRTLMTALQGDRSWRLLFHDAMEAELDHDATRAVVRVEDDQHDLAHVLVGGPVLAVALALRGRPPLHASAVATHAGAVAFAGPSGAGKTTLAAMACAAGAHLLSDDTLALELDGDVITAAPGSTQLRLRPGVASLAERLEGPEAKTADGRFGIDLGPGCAPESVSLRAVVIANGFGGQSLRRLSGAEAATALLTAARVASLEIPFVQRAFLRLVASLARTVPVYELSDVGTEPSLSLPAPVLALLGLAP